MKEFAPGIKRKDYFGNINKIKPGQVLDYVQQYHQALRAGPHYDFRIGDKDMGMYSWVLRQPLQKHDGERQHAIRTNLHTHAYKDWEGSIPAGSYGGGKVTKHDEGKVLITNTSPETISFSVAHKKHPERYTLVHPDKYGIKNWILMRNKTPAETGAEKSHYKAIPKDKVEEKLKDLEPESSVQPKVDGALNFLNLINGKAEMLSHRISKTTGKPVVQTERFFGKIPHLPDLPKEFRNSVLMTEVYGNRDGKAVGLQDLGAILNSSPAKALQKQKDNNITMKGVLFDIAQHGEKKINPKEIPYAERRALLERILAHLPKDHFELPEEAKTPEEALALHKRIKNKQHPLTEEGVVIHPPRGLPMKAKNFQEGDVYIRSFFDAEPNSKYAGKAVGGFSYSLTPDGPIVGKCGTGLNDETRKMMYNNPKQFIGRKARIHSHGQFNSEAHRVPAFLALHEG